MRRNHKKTACPQLRRHTHPQQQSQRHGQHFLRDKQIIEEMIKQADIQPADTVIDIGAGAGAITLALAQRAGSVLAVEKDNGLAQTLRKRSASLRNVTVVEKDIMNLRLPRDPYLAVANIPFYMTTSILKLLMNGSGSKLKRAILLIEKGAALGFTSRPITKPSILAWRMWYDLKMIRVVERRHFSPPPKVDAALLLIQKKTPAFLEEHHFHRFLAFAEDVLRYPRMPVYLALSGIFTPPQIKKLCLHAGVDRDFPICKLNEQQWAAVYTTMIQHVPSFRWPK
ncbi:23S ribosomal RNA methyltransferase Erm [Marinicrinis lubricantis]|uniref:rRNA adenine N-6-methyltransferase n=1 Tax=Marinicrinis lubricantis TaxID=2086470 RepID=A0ABW1IS81_9BACL